MEENYYCFEEFFDKNAILRPIKYFYSFNIAKIMQTMRYFGSSEFDYNPRSVYLHTFTDVNCILDLT